MKVMIRFGERGMLTNCAAGDGTLGLFRLVKSHAAKKPAITWNCWSRVL